MSSAPDLAAGTQTISRSAEGRRRPATEPDSSRDVTTWAVASGMYPQGKGLQQKSERQFSGGPGWVSSGDGRNVTAGVGTESGQPVERKTSARWIKRRHGSSKNPAARPARRKFP